MRQARPQQPLTPFEEAVQQDVQGNATEAQLELLTTQPQSWLDALVDLKRTVELQFSRRRADLKEFQQACLALGPEGKDAYFQRRADYESWRAKALGYATAVERRTKHVRKSYTTQPLVDVDLSTLCARAKTLIEDFEEDTDVKAWLADYQKVTQKTA